MIIRIALLILALSVAILAGSIAFAQGTRGQDPAQIAQLEEELEAAPDEEAEAAPEEELEAAPDEEPEAAPDEEAEALSRPVLKPDAQIEEIIVTGTQSESAGDFAEADSITAFKPDDLEALGAQSIADLANFTPNLEIVTAGSTTPTFFIRGVGLNDFNANSTSAVSVYRDDVHVNSPALQLGALFDVEAINILRGPQGYGSARNASAGVIKFYSRKPTGEFGGYLRSDYGNYDFLQLEGAIEAPILSDVLSGRLAFTLSDRDGFIKNRCGNAPPDSERVVYPRRRIDREGKGPTDPPWSICGETVMPPNQAQGTDGLSNLPEGLPDRVNDLGFWAARGTLLFEPTLDMSWLVNAHGSRRNEFSRLGQAYGTGNYFCLDGDLENCNVGYPAGSRILNLLGGMDAEQYMAIEVKERLAELAPCLAIGETCDTPEERALENAAKLTVAKELADDLDSDPWEGDFNRVGKTKNDTWGMFARGEIGLPLGLHLTTITAYDTYDRLVDIDLDFTPNILFQIVTKDQGWQFFQDAMLHGEFGGEYEGFWDIGGFSLIETIDVQVANDFGKRAAFNVANRVYTQELYSGALYANTSMDFWEDFTIDGGFRWNWDHKKIDYVLGRAGQLFPWQDEATWSAPTGGVRLTYRFREDTHAYWKYTRGWKGGHYNATSSDIQVVSVAEPEVNNAFEVGLRGSYFDGRVGLNLSLFYYSYEEYQIFTAQQYLNGQPEFVILNANEAEVYGGEADLIAKPWEGAFLNVRVGWLETQFLDFVQVQQTSFPTASGLRLIVNREIQASGHPLLNSPEFKVSITAEQTIRLGRYGSLIPRYDGAWSDDIFYDATAGRGIPNAQNVEFMPENTIGQRAFWLHNLRLTYRLPSENVEFAFWVRNLTNKAYKTFAFDGSTFNNTTIYFVGEPRMYGLSFSVHF